MDVKKSAVTQYVLPQWPNDKFTNRPLPIVLLWEGDAHPEATASSLPAPAWPFMTQWQVHQHHDLCLLWKGNAHPVSSLPRAATQQQA